MSWFLSTMTVLRNSFLVPLHPVAFSIHPTQQKTAALYTYVYCVLYIHSDSSNISNELKKVN